jgi:tetratricopeptide (TPR) repeat protein
MRSTSKRLKILFTSLLWAVLCGGQSSAVAQGTPGSLAPARHAVFTLVGEKSLGSGFVVRSDGLAVTAYHVIANCRKATARFSGGVSAEIVGVVMADPKKDLALIKLEGEGFSALPLGNSELLQKGDRVWAVGSPMGAHLTVTKGLVLGFRNVPGIVRQIQMSAPTRPGNSGGPVFDSHGRVVAVSVSVVLGVEELYYAVALKELSALPGRNAPVRPLAEVHRDFLGSAAELFIRANGVLRTPDGKPRKEAAQKETLEKALQLYLQAIQKRGDFSEARLNAGTTYIRLGRLAEALAQFKEALRLSPDDITARHSVAGVSNLLGRQQEAEQQATELVRMSPAYAPGRYLLGLVYDGQKRLMDARSQFEAAVRLKPNYADARFALGRVYDRMGRLPDAVKEYRQAIAAKPELAEAHFFLGMAYTRSERHKEALSEMKEAVRLRPESPLFLYYLGSQYHVMDDRAGAKTMLEALRKLDPKLAAKLETQIK